MLKPHLISTVNQKVLSLLVKFPDQEFYEREVSRKLGISSGAANRALNRLFTSRVVKRRREGKMCQTSSPASRSRRDSRVSASSW